MTVGTHGGYGSRPVVHPKPPQTVVYDRNQRQYQPGFALIRELLLSNREVRGISVKPC